MLEPKKTTVNASIDQNIEERGKFQDSHIRRAISVVLEKLCCHSI